MTRHRLSAVSLYVGGVEVADEGKVRQHIHQQHLCMEETINLQLKEVNNWSSEKRGPFFIL